MFFARLVVFAIAALTVAGAPVASVNDKRLLVEGPLEPTLCSVVGAIVDLLGLGANPIAKCHDTGGNTIPTIPLPPPPSVGGIPGVPAIPGIPAIPSVPTVPTPPNNGGATYPTLPADGGATGPASPTKGDGTDPSNPTDGGSNPATPTDGGAGSPTVGGATDPAPAPTDMPPSSGAPTTCTAVTHCCDDSLLSNAASNGDDHAGVLGAALPIAINVNVSCSPISILGSSTNNVCTGNRPVTVCCAGDSCNVVQPAQ